MGMTDRDRLVSRLAAVARIRRLRRGDWARLAQCVEEHLSEVQADGALYDSLRGGPGKFSALVGAVSRALERD
jgi:hypothetical protein